MNTNTLLTPLNRLSTDLALRDLTRALLDGTVESIASGWPHVISTATAATWSRGSDVVVELARVPIQQNFEVALLLPATSATRLVDRLLGAPSETGVASELGGPSEVECGLLAYLAARLCAAWSEALTVREVRRAGAAAMPCDECVLWPLAITTSFGVLQSSLLLSPSEAERVPQVELAVTLADALAPGTSLDRARVGDVLVSDRWLLSATTDGLSGDVRLAAAGASFAMDATLERGLVRARGPAQPCDGLELVLGERTASLLELARLASGTALELDASADAQVLLRRSGEPFARGALVSQRGRVGMRIDELNSALTRSD